MTSQINGLNQAANNANDGVSLTQTASGALSEITNDLQTMRDLAVQSLNATNSAQDRADLNTQFQQLMADINNVATNTQFNGVNLLDGSFQGATFQVGANAGQTITVSSIASATATLSAISTSRAAPRATYGRHGGRQPARSVHRDAADHGRGAGHLHDQPITLTGNAATDCKPPLAAAINQRSAPDGGVVATVNAARHRAQQHDARADVAAARPDRRAGNTGTG